MTSILTQQDEPKLATIITTARKTGATLKACSWCQTEAMKAALRNEVVSHGICPRCFAEQMGKVVRK